MSPFTELKTRFPLKIRRATIKDFETIYSFICELEEMSFDKRAFRQIFLKNLSLANIHYYVAEIRTSGIKKQVIGFISIHIQYQLHHCGKVAEIMELFVDEEFRNLKIGAALIDTALKTAGINNCGILEVASGRRRKDAPRFYKKKNFAKTHFKLTKEL